MLGDAVAAIERAGFVPGEQVSLAIDVAASHFFADGRYQLGQESLSDNGMIDAIATWCDRYPIISVEDGLAEDDWAHWPRLRKELAGQAITLGDDSLCTNPARIQRAIDERAAECAAAQGQPGRDVERSGGRLSAGAGARAGRSSSARAAARRRTTGWPIWPSAGAGTISRWGRSTSPSGSRSTIGCWRSRRKWAQVKNNLPRIARIFGWLTKIVCASPTSLQTINQSAQSAAKKEENDESK